MEIKRNHRESRGFVNIYVVLIMMAMIGFIGLACDVGYLVLVGHQLQNAADASALAGAQKVRVDTLPEARQLAWNLAYSNRAAKAAVALSMNEANAANGNIVIGRYYRSTRTFVPTLAGADAIKVVAPRPDTAGKAVGLLFGPLFGVKEANLTRHAIAMTVQGTGAAVLALNPHDPDTFHMNGNCSVVVNNGAIQVDSDNDGSIVVKGNSGEVYASDLNVCADDASLRTHFDGNLNRGAPYMPDPLLGLPEPAISPPLTVPSGKDVTIDPGYYPNFPKLNGGKSVTMRPGVYILDGLDMTGGGNLYANGVMIFLTNKGNLNLGGNGVIQISAMTTGPYAGVSLFQARDNKSTASIQGTNQMTVTGTIYVPGATLSVGGAGNGFGNQLIADKIDVFGNGVININYDGRFPGKAKVFLVE